MTSTEFLKRVCEGYVRSYRSLGIRGGAKSDFNPFLDLRAADVTHRELDFFLKLGEMLGFVARREVARKDRTRCDLSWVDIESEELFLCLESETFDRRADKTMEKLLGAERSKEPRYLVAKLWVKDARFAKFKQAIFERLKGHSLLLLAWVGPDMYNATTLEVIVASEGNIYTRQAIAESDEDKYWYARFLGGWQNATSNRRGRPRTRGKPEVHEKGGAVN